MKPAGQMVELTGKLKRYLFAVVNEMPDQALHNQLEYFCEDNRTSPMIVKLLKAIEQKRREIPERDLKKYLQWKRTDDNMRM